MVDDVFQLAVKALVSLDSEMLVDLFDLLDRITGSLPPEPDKTSAEFKALCEALGYCWSVAVAARPDPGKGRLERWIGEADHDICRVMNENLKKKRLLRLDPVWVEAQRERLGC